MEPLRKHLLYHAPDKGVDLHRFPLDPLALVGPIMLRDPMSIIAINASEGDRGTHDLFGEIGRQALISGGDIALLHVRHKSFTIARVTGIDESMPRWSLHSVPEHRQQIPLPLLAQ